MLPNFSPIQPYPGFAEKIIYREVQPDSRLRGFIHCYWEMHSDGPLTEEYSCKIVSDACFDVFADVTNAEQSFAMGVVDGCSSYLCGARFHYAGVRFLPGMFAFFFNVNASEFTNRVVEMSAVNKGMAQFLIENVGTGIGAAAVGERLDTYFLRMLGTGRRFDHRVRQALSIIMNDAAALNIERDVAGRVDVGSRQLLRLFDHYIGYGIRSFIQVVRFQRCLRAHLDASRDIAERVYFDFGYYDQGHFIRQFKKFGGQTPGRLLRMNRQ